MDRLEYRCLQWNDEVVMIRLSSCVPYDKAEVSIFPRTKCRGKSVILSWPFDSLCQLTEVPSLVCLN